MDAISPEQIEQRLWAAQKAAFRKGQYSSAIRALEILARIKGMMNEPHELSDAAAQLIRALSEAATRARGGMIDSQPDDAPALPEAATT